MSGLLSLHQEPIGHLSRPALHEYRRPNGLLPRTMGVLDRLARQEKYRKIADRVEVTASQKALHEEQRDVHWCYW